MRNRHVSYSTHQEIANKGGGGVAIYCKEHISAQARQFIQNVTDLAVYRPPHYGFEDFMKNLKSLLDYLDIVDEQVIGSLKCRGKNCSGIILIQTIHATDHHSND